MKKLLSLILLAVFAFVNVNAQNKMALGVGANLALPMGDFSNVASTGFGAGAKYEYFISPNLSATGALQYLMFGEKNNVTYKILPILVGAKYYSGNLYGMFELGFNNVNTTIKTSAVSYGGVVVVPATEVSASSSKFGFALGGGYELAMGANSLDISVSYQNYASSTAAINLGVAYKFGL